MSAGDTSAESKRALYWLGDQLIVHRHTVSIVVLLITAVFAYWTSQLRLETSFGELLPQNHPFVQTHNQYSSTFGGANNLTVMLQVREGTIFTPEQLSRIFRMTEAVDRVYGINHNQIDSIGHRTTRHLKVGAAGIMRSEPVMLAPVKNDGDAANIRRIVHNSQNIYGLLVSLDDKAALIRANYVEGRLDHRRTFDEVNELVQWSFGEGWIGALVQIPRADDDPVPGALVETVYPGSAAATATLQPGDRILEIGETPIERWFDLGKLLREHPVGSTVALTVKRGEAEQKLSLTIPEPNADVYIAGEPRLYGWVYSYTSDVFFILVTTYIIEWILRWLYFHDWRGALRPTLTGLLAAIWGLGFIYVIGLAMDPLMLVIPFIITARAVSHAIQMHERYYEEMHRQGWDKRKAIVASFAELCIPTISGVVTDALGVLVILLVPVIMLQKLAVTASFWILAVTVSEILLNPIVYYYLRAPDPELVILRERGWMKGILDRITDFTLSFGGRMAIIVFWAAIFIGSVVMLRGLTIGDPTTASPLVAQDSPYNVSHGQIQQTFGGVEPLIIVNEGYDKDAMKDPTTLRSMQGFQRTLERDPDVGYSFSLVDILIAVNAVFHELEPKWGVIPNNWVDIGGLFFVFFSTSPPTETAKYVDASYKTSHVTFFCRNHKGDTIRRIMGRVEEYIGRTSLEQLGLELTENLEAETVTITKLVANGAAAKAELAEGDVIRFVGDVEIHSLHDFYRSLREEALGTPIVGLEVERGGGEQAISLEVPWKAQYRLAGGLIGVLAAANEELLTNDLMMNVLAFLTNYIVLLFTYRSWAAGLYLMAPLIAANGFVNAYMSARGIGINIQTLPVVTVGVGFGIDYGIYTISRAIEEMPLKGNLHAAIKEALLTSGKAVAFTAITMIASTLMWLTSNIRFNAEMGLLLALWMGVSFVACQTLIPALVLTLKPGFMMRELPVAAEAQRASEA